MNRTTYDAAFRIMKTQKEMCSKLESVGLRFEYGDGFTGKSLESLINDSETIILESLGLHFVSKNTKTTLCGESWPTTVEVLYSEDDNPEWAITADDFFEFFYKAIDNNHLQDLMWRIIVARDYDAKTEYNKLGIGKVGGYDFMYNQ
jgi:hypothetical protein